MNGMTTITLPASEVKEGDFIPGLDNGYVHTDPAPPRGSRSDGQFNFAYPDGTVEIEFHTAEGEEASVTCPEDMPITVERSSSDVGTETEIEYA